jgi:hypothetical protein
MAVEAAGIGLVFQVKEMDGREEPVGKFIKSLPKG